MAPIDLSTNYLDIWNILKFEIIGDGGYLLIFILAAVIFYLCIKFAVPFTTQLWIGAFFFIVIAVLTYNWMIYVLVITAIGLISYYWIAQIIQRVR